MRFSLVTSGAAFCGGAASGARTELAGGSEFGDGNASGRDIAIWFAGATGFLVRNAIPPITSSATNAAAGINHRGPTRQSHAPAVFFSATSASPTLLARAIAASCSRQTEQREKCKS